MDLLSALEVICKMDENKLTNEERDAMRVLYTVFDDIICEYMDEAGIEYSRKFTEDDAEYDTLDDSNSDWLDDEEGGDRGWD